MALMIVFLTQKKIPTPPITYPPPVSPYVCSIVGAGLIQASSENISIGSPFAEIIEEIYVKEGDFVKAGDPLFRLDTRAFEAQTAFARKSLELEEVILADKRKQFSFYERLKNKTSVSEQAYQQASYAVKEAELQNYVSQANILQYATNINRSTISSPIDGLVLQINYHVGEIASALPSPTLPMISQTNPPMILIGKVNPLFVRIDIDEDDAWRFKKGASATAFVRGNSRLHFPLKFERVEPFVIPKASFTGDTTERIDTRVLQVLYSFEKKDLPIYCGQILDVFIEDLTSQNCLE